MNNPVTKPGADREQQLRDMNEALLVSSVRQHELTEQAEKAEHAAARLAETSSKIVEQSPFGTYIVDSQFRIAHVSAGALPPFRNVRPLIGRDFAEAIRIIWPEPFASQAIAIFRHTLETGEPYVSPGLTEQRRDIGATESYEWQVHRLTLADGQYGVVCYFFDSTRLRQTEAALRESEAKYRAIFDGAAVSLWDEDFSAVKAALDELTAQGVRDYPRYFEQHPEFVQKALSLVRVRAVNDTSVRMFEARDKAELLGNLPKIFTPASLPIFIQELITVAEGRTFMQGEALLNTARGNPLWVLFTMSMPLAPARFDQVLFSLLDIRQIKEAEEAIARLAAIVTSSEDAIISKSLEGIITTWNRGAERLFGYAAAEIIGKSVTQLIPDDHLDEEPRILERIRRGEVVEHYETVRRRKDGSLLDISLTVSPLRDAAGRIIGASKIARDITESRRLEKQTREQAAALSDLHRRKDEFLAMLSHELRNPLAPIANAVQLLRLQRASENQIEHQARTIIERQVGQLKHLIDDLLEVSRISTGRIHLHQERVAVSGVVEFAVETVRSLIVQRRHTLEVSVPPGPIWLYGDVARLEQVVVNLLTNAAKYTDDGGHIWLTVEVASRERERPEECVLRVRDTGVGIAPELLPRIFDLFTQAERSLDRSQGGLGIGLSLVQRLVELHGGTVAAHSVLGQGSEFVVRLPLLKDEARRAKDESGTGASDSSFIPHPSFLKVLVVDDNVDAAESLPNLLKATGHDARTAHDGPAVVDAAHDYMPDVVLLDIGLPGLNGYEVARRIRQQPTLKNIVLVAMTGYGQESDRQRSREAGFDHHLVKPADFKNVQRILASMDGRPPER